jgi:hypothetical protein
MRALLVHGGSCDRELRQIRLSLEAQDCQVVILDVESTAADEKRRKAITALVEECDVVVIMIDVNLPLVDVQISVLAAKVKGKKIVGIQLTGATAVELLEKFGTALIPFAQEKFAQEKIVAAVCGEYVEWANEKGEPRPQPETERHVCKKRKSDAAA